MKKLENYKLANYSGKVLVQYLRKKNGGLQGVVVSIGKSTVGWSLCNPLDSFNKEKGLAIALARAEKAATLTELEDRAEFYSNCPHSLTDIFIKIFDRSAAYFKPVE